MDAASSRWHEITPSAYPHERAALEHVRDLLPDRHPYQAWSNFTFISDQGHIREVDLLVAAPTGLFLVEIKNFRGRLTNHYGTWILRGERGQRSFDNPLPLADQKAKELKTLFTRAASRDRGIKLPFVRAVIFLAEPSMACELDDDQRHHLYGPDTGQASPNRLPKVGQNLLLAPVTQAPPQSEFLGALPRLLQKVGIHRTKRSISVGPWQIEPRPYDQGPTWQDHHARREDIEGAYRRIRIYLYERESDPETRDSIRRAAHREFGAGQGVQHPGLLVPNDLLDHEMGPALLIEQQPDALRLDHYLAQHGTQLDLPARLGLVRQLAEAVSYAHDRRLVHRALSPRAVIVERAGGGWHTPRLRVGEWQTAARGSSTTQHRVVPTTHAGQHVEAAAAPYLAPEFFGAADGTVSIDIFGLGSTAYLVLTGQPPAQSRAELMERLTSEGGLHPAVVSDAIPDDVDALVALATDPRVADRFADVEEFLAHLDEIPDAGTDPDPVELDPWNASKGTELPDGSVVLRVLGTGATARAFHVIRDGLESVLKVGRSAQTEERLADEATALESLRHDHLVVLKRGLFPLGPRHAIEIDYAGARTLAQLLREEGALLPDQLQHLGDQLLEVLGYLYAKETFHRDIKPDNLGVRTHPRRDASLVLFDFSLAGAPTSDVHAGTRGYRDPFLGTDRRPSYDEAAERYAAAATLHEMASLELPTWGEDGTDPRFVDQVTLSSELFDPALREPLTRFFRRALDRDAEQRFPSVGAMREAWRHVFTAVDEQPPATSSYSQSDDPQELRDEAAQRATADTALDTSGLTLRAVAVAQRLGANTVGELIKIRDRTLWQARGLPKATRAELVARAGQWRRALAGTTPTRKDVAPDEPTGPVLTLDAVVARLIPVTTRRNDTQADLTCKLLGLPDEQGTLPPTRWPTLSEVADASGLTAGRIAQVMGKRRREWSRESALQAVHEDLVEALAGLCRVAAATELADQLLLLRGCEREEEPQRRRAYGYAVLRAVVEADSLSDEPRFAVRRHADRVLIALQVSQDEPLDTPGDGQLLDLASGLADEAARLAAGDPLPTPAAVVRALAAVATRVGVPFAERRLAQLAAAAAGSVLANARLELYPCDLDPVRALRLAQAGAGVPTTGVEPEWFDARVRARFPGLPPLPRGRELTRLLAEAGVQLVWNGTRFCPPEPPVSGYTSLRASSSIASASPAGSAAADVATRLAHVATQGGVRVVTVRRAGWARCRSQLAAVLDVPVRDGSAEFVAALRAVATERKIPDFSVVLRADAADPGSKADTNLQRLVSAAFEKLEQQWSTAEVLLLDGLTPLGRYPSGMALLERLADRARRAGRDGGPSALVLLCPAEDERQPPRVGGHAVGLVTPEEWVVATRAWLRDETGAA